MKLKNKIGSFFVIMAIMSSCYEDKGNYDYVDINEIEVKGVEKEYFRDMDEVLEIKPELTCTQYSDTTLFDYAWTIGDAVVGRYHDLNIKISMDPGKKNCRFTITDKRNKVKKFTEFALNISSATAGDLIVVLSKYKGKAEMSYLRLDKPSEFTINYFGSRYTFPLGVKPQQIAFIDTKTDAEGTYPFTYLFGRMAVLVDDKTFMFEKHTMSMDTMTYQIHGDDYVDLAIYPKPNVSEYKSQFILSTITMWRIISNGTKQEGCEFAEISQGYVYKFAVETNANNPKKYFQIKNESYPGCNYSPFCFYDRISDSPNPKNYPVMQGNDLGSLVVFDKTSGRFGFVPSNSSSASEVGIDKIPPFQGYNMIYGSDTNENTTFFAVLNNGAMTKILVMNSNLTIKNPYTLVSQVDVPNNIIKPSTKFYTMKYVPYLLFVTDNKLYRCNIANIKAGIAPSESNLVATLTDYGYDADATITDICVSRGERSILLGVSRYNGDSEANSNELKGDILVLNLDKSNVTVTFNKIHKGISGIPVDVAIKYQNHYLNGINYVDGSYIDAL